MNKTKCYINLFIDCKITTFCLYKKNVFFLVKFGIFKE
jgi:hypothetical protein